MPPTRANGKICYIEFPALALQSDAFRADSLSRYGPQAAGNHSHGNRA
jgi:hypothetical protein